MKKLLIVNNNMHIGGVQRSLVNLLKQIEGRYDITLLLFSATGEMLSQIPAGVKVLSLHSPYRYMGMTRQDAKGMGQRLCRNTWAAMTKLFGRSVTCRVMAGLQKSLGPFDVAISFLHSGPQKMFYGGCNEFVLERVQAERKVTFLHCDYEQIQADHEENRRLYQRFDGIGACSGGCREAFLRIMPQLAEKVMVVPNCQDHTKIRELAEKDRPQWEQERLQVLTVARFGREKGITRAIRAIGALEQNKRDLDYTVIGDGVEFQEAQEMVRELGLEGTVHLVGERENPYGAMAAADLLLIPSVSEAAPMVIGEAASLATPILTTKTSSAQEMVEQTGYGWVCDNSLEGIRAGLGRILEDPQLLSRKRAYLKTLRFDNERAVSCFEQLVNG